MLEDVGNFLTKGVTGVAVSGLYSLVNTPADLSNKVFGTDFSRADTASTMASIDASWGDYYTKHKDAIDTAGFFAGGLLPGSLAVKGLKLAQEGVMGGAFKNVLGFASTRETLYLNRAITQLETEGGTIFQRINTNKLNSMAWGAADQALQTAAFSTAAALATQSSPMLDNEDWKHQTWDILSTSLLWGGVGGGALGAIMTNKLLKNAGKQVDVELRKVDILRSPGDVGLGFGDKAFAIIDAVTALPEEVSSSVVALNHARKGVKDSLDITPLVNRTRRDSILRGKTQLDLALSSVVDGDPSVGLPLANSLVGVLQEGLTTGKSMGDIRSELGNTLWRLHSVEGLGNRPADISGELKFLNPNATIDKEGSSVFSPVRTPESQFFRVVGDEAQAKTATLGKEAMSATEAYKLGFDLVLDPTSKKISVSPLSSIYQQVEAKEVDFSALFLNTRTKQTGLDVVPTIADIQTVKNRLSDGTTLPGVNIGGVTSGDKSFAFRTSTFPRPADSVEATARHLWADNLPKVFGKVNSEDIAVLETLAKSPEKAAPDLIIKDLASGGETLFSDILDPETYLFKQKMAVAKSELVLQGDAADIRDIAHRVNVDPGWMKLGIESKWDAKELFKDTGWKRDAAAYANRENLILRYNTAGMDNAANNAVGMVGFNTRVKAATDRALATSNSVLGDAADKFISVGASLAGEADSQLVGAGMTSASNANYFDKLRTWGQYTGTIVAKTITDRVNALLPVLQSPAATLLQNPLAAAEVSSLVTASRLSGDSWSLYRDGLTGKPSIVDTASFNKIAKGAAPAFERRIELSAEAGDFIEAHHELYKNRLQQQGALMTATGQEIRIDPNKLYFPPVDTQRVPFFAFVRQQEGTIFASSEVAMLTARSAAELDSLSAQVLKNPQLQVIYKDGTELYHKAKQDYDFKRVMNDTTIDSTLRKDNSLGTYLPNMTPEAIVEDFVTYHSRAESQLVRDATGLRYAQSIAELDDLSARYTASQQSSFKGLQKYFKAQDPYGDAVKLAMNVSKLGEFTLWHQANEFVDSVGTRAFRGVEKAMLEAKGGQITWQEANDKLQQFGLGAHYVDEDAFKVAQTASDRNLIKTGMKKANMLIATGMLRLDWANSILNVISTPILLGAEVSSIRNSIKNDPELFASFNDMLGVKVPGTDVVVPSTLKLISNAIAAMMGPDTQALSTRFKSIDAIKGLPGQFHAMIDDLSLTPNLVPSKWAQTVDSWVDKGAKFTFSDQAEDATRFVTAHAMLQITDPIVAKGAMTVQEQNAFISTFVNRVQGNYTASQRPMMFQGTLGSAISLFQTYQFNMFQQLYRHIENKDMKTLAVMGGLQGTLFGANGLPLFGAINTQLVGNASINEGHNDAYSYAVKAAGKDIGDWLMYGTASAFPLWSEQAPALWTRGDLNPRSAFVVPTSPMDVPGVQGAIKVVSGLITMAKQLGNGAGVQDALLFGLEHNGINRPLSGLAQVLKGNATTGKGDLISAAQDWDSIATAARLIGAKPMDESIALSTIYKNKAYQALDKERIDSLGTTIKEKLRGNKPLSTEDFIDFQGKYAAAGGNIQGYAKAVQRWDKAANVSLVNQVLAHSQTSAGARLNAALGGEPLEDYTSQRALGE